MSRPLARGDVEGVVSRCEQDVVAPDVAATRELDSVVAARHERGGEVTGVAGDPFVSRDASQLRA